MIEKFLTAKHWQLFLLTLGIPLIFKIFLLGSIIPSILSENQPNPDLVRLFFYLFPIMMIVLVGILFGWFWSIAIGLDRQIPERLKLNIDRFKTALFIPLIYIVGLSIFIGITITGMMSNGNEPNLVFLIIIMPLHILAMVCIIYCLYFVAKTIKTAETQEEVGFGDFIREFFLIWLFPIGIWIIQPEINEMVEA